MYHIQVFARCLIELPEYRITVFVGQKIPSLTAARKYTLKLHQWYREITYGRELKLGSLVPKAKVKNIIAWLVSFLPMRMKIFTIFLSTERCSWKFLCIFHILCFLVRKSAEVVSLQTSCRQIKVRNMKYYCKKSNFLKCKSQVLVGFLLLLLLSKQES